MDIDESFGHLCKENPSLRTRSQRKRSNQGSITMLEQKCRGAIAAKRQELSPESAKLKTQKELVNEGYFAGYSNFGIHKDMLNDFVRMEQYAKTITETCEDKVILDLGSGTGVLSVLAIKARAKKVYAVDKADIEKLMNSEFKQFIKEGKIEFIKSTIEELALEEYPRIPKVDVILSEWMGYFLVYENMISSYLLAIKAFLKPEGIVVPAQASIYLDTVSYDFAANTKLAKKHFNDNPCKVVLIEQCKPQYLLSKNPTSIKAFDFNDKELQNPLDNKGFACNFKIQVAKAGTFNALVGSFDAKLCNGVSLNTMPLYPVTHWKQSIFFIASPIQVEIGDTIEGKICIKTQEENHRNLMVSLTYKVEGKGGSEAEELFTFE